MEFRTLTANEIECRVSTIKESGLSLLLYKDARCDMNILDETVGNLDWQRSHTRDNANCIVSIWDKGKAQWISKEDTGTESYTEKEKGQASDSFKRACFNWGIGRELYTAPFIWIKPLDNKEIYSAGVSFKTNTHFKVNDIGYEGKKIVSLSIHDNKGRERYNMAKKPVKPENKNDRITANQIQELISLGNRGRSLEAVMKYYKVSDISELAQADAQKIIDKWRTQ